MTTAFDTPEQDAPFNFSLFYYVSLNKYLDSKDEAYLKNDIKSWYKYLYTIYKRICFKLKPEESNLLQDLFDEILNHLSNDKLLAVKKLHEADIKIINYMDQYKMIFPRINANVGLRKLDQRYGLGEFSKNKD